jgi:glycosyltransferase involved in cell wall biosynthesis
MPPAPILNAPKVSISIPAYRQADLLRRALESIAEQTFRDFEVVITDDSPDDAVERVAAEFGPCFAVRYCRNVKRLGPPENWNEAVRQSRGELVKILHHDDWFYDRDSLQNLVRIMEENPEAALGFGYSMCCSAADGKRTLHAPGLPLIQAIRNDPNELFYGNTIGAPSATIFRRKDFQPFDGHLKWVVDLEFYVRLLRRKPELALWAQPVVCVAEDLATRVTSECLGNPEVEVYEWLYFYRKLDTGILPAWRRLRYLCYGFRRLGLETPGALQPYLRELSLPLYVRWFLKARRMTQKLRRMVSSSRPTVSEA